MFTYPTDMFYQKPMVRQPSDLPAPIGTEEGLNCVRGTNRKTPGTQSHRTQGHRCQDLGKELQRCYCCSKRNFEQTNDKEFQPPLPLHATGVTVEEKVNNDWPFTA